MSDFFDVASAIIKAGGPDKFRLRLGQIVSAQNDGTVTVTIAGGATQVPGVKVATACHPIPGRTCWIATDGRDLFVLDTLGGQPLACKVYRTADQSIANYSTAWTTVTWQADSFDSGSMWTSGTDVSIPVRGIYQVTACASWAGNTAGTYRGCLIQRVRSGAATDIAYTQLSPLPGTVAMVQQATGFVTCEVGDGIRLLVRQNSGASLALNGGSFSDSHMVVTYIGPNS